MIIPVYISFVYTVAIVTYSIHIEYYRLLAIFEDEYFLVATRSSISRVSLDGQRYEVLINNLVNSVAVDYDYR